MYCLHDFKCRFAAAIDVTGVIQRREPSAVRRAVPYLQGHRASLAIMC
jgi:hypothetical protein